MLLGRNHQGIPDHHLPGPAGRVEAPRSIAYVRQRSADLIYHLFESPAPRKTTRVLAEREVALAGGSIVLAIIGSSHFLEVQVGDSVLCELLACPRPSLEGAPTMVRLGDREALAHRFLGNGLIYRFDLRRSHYSGAEFEAESLRLSSPSPNRLQFVFPAGGEPRGAITCLEWQVSGGRVSIITRHTFPAESTIVHTCSVIDVVETGETS